MIDHLLAHGGYFAIGSFAYQVYQKENGSLRARGYFADKGFVDMDGWEILSVGEKITKEEYDELIEYENVSYAKRLKDRGR